ncbi:hypothetical protein CFIMG_008139RA00001 [Ceratocystis fimbriata CBS 114723]|uniref:Uncharacterized protein n=1 Tax=Ceratocystis fimbriata CBS 114723 TaxID=1035309 RepID=A0A2C5X7U8_9PEZI|nr:hypothetical protein CFIMG_008139RA00001 [Ceratocystis fimbriata CBS 114723]
MYAYSKQENDHSQDMDGLACCSKRLSAPLPTHNISRFFRARYYCVFIASMMLSHCIANAPIRGFAIHVPKI